MFTQNILFSLLLVCVYPDSFSLLLVASTTPPRDVFLFFFAFPAKNSCWCVDPKTDGQKFQSRSVFLCDLCTFCDGYKYNTTKISVSFPAQKKTLIWEQMSIKLLFCFQTSQQELRIRWKKQNTKITWDDVKDTFTSSTTKKLGFGWNK